MSATYTAEYLRSRLNCSIVEFDPDSGSETLVTLDKAGAVAGLSLTGVRKILVGLHHSVGTGGITTARIQGATDSAGTGAVTAVEITPTTNDAVNDVSWAECNIEQIREVLATATHWVLAIDLVTSTDELVIAVIQDMANPRTGLTANYIA